MEQNQQQQPENGQEQQQQSSDKPTGLAGLLGTIAEIIGKKKDERMVTCNIDMKIYGLNVRQFNELNVRLKAFLEQLREEGVIAKDTEFSTLATAKDADSQIDDFDRISHELHGIDQAMSHGGMKLDEYKAGLVHVNKRVRNWLEANEFALKMADKHDLDTPEGLAAAEAEAAAAKAADEAKAAGTATTHFSPEQQSAD